MRNLCHDSIEINEAKSNFSQLINQVKKGHSFYITDSRYAIVANYWIATSLRFSRRRLCEHSEAVQSLLFHFNTKTRKVSY